MHDINMNDFQWLEYYPGIASHAPDVTINVNKIIFNSAVLKKLNDPSSIKLSFDPKGKRIAIQGFAKKVSGSIDFVPERKSKCFIIGKLDRVQFVRKLMPEWDESTRYKITGDYYEKENVMVFDLNTAVVFNGGNFSKAKTTTQ